jgi:hypothetical protein
MARVFSFRVTDEEAAWADEYVKARGVKRQEFLAAGFRSYRQDCMGGVPDVPEEVRVAPRVMHQQPPQPDLAKAEQEMRAAVWARQARLNEGKDRASGSQR